MLWTDVTGPNNTIDKLTGSVTVTKGTVVSSLLKGGYAHTQVSQYASDYTGKKSLTCAPNYSSSVIFGGALHGCYLVYFREPGTTNETTQPLRVCVSPSVFD